MTGNESEARYSSIYVPLTVIISPRSTSIIRSVHSNLDTRMSLSATTETDTVWTFTFRKVG